MTPQELWAHLLPYQWYTSLRLTAVGMPRAEGERWLALGLPEARRYWEWGHDDRTRLTCQCDIDKMTADACWMAGYYWGEIETTDDPNRIEQNLLYIANCYGRLGYALNIAEDWYASPREWRVRTVYRP
jgi:hypothetical protein